MMGLKRTTSTIYSLLLIIGLAHSQSHIFDVTKYGGAITNGKMDITQALLSAWKQACAVGGTVIIPKGIYTTGAMTLFGPCKGATILNVQGTLQAPANPELLNGKAWITFDHINQLTVMGGGIFDGQGQTAWKQCQAIGNCGSGLNVNLMFYAVTNSKVQHVNSLNSKSFHVTLLGCNNFTVQNFTAKAPANSPNTDGIHIGRSKNINITNTIVGTGDDCISIGDGSQGVIITGVTCGPGHGISVGSLGRYANEQPVSGVIVKSCTLSNTLNGVRIKSWPALFGGSASNIHFETITMNNVQNPVIIDQRYCPNGACNNKGPSKVKINNVSFRDIHGTSATPIAIQLSCSSIFPCQNIQLGGIYLKYNGGDTKAQCTNVRPIFTGQVPLGC